MDPVNNVLAVMTRQGVLVFGRTANGDAAPQWVIAGPKTGISGPGAIRRVVVYPEGKRIFASGAIRGDRANFDFLAEEDREEGFVGVWKYGDQGDIPAWGIFKGFRGVAINPKAKEVIGGGSGNRGIHTYHVPELFE